MDQREFPLLGRIDAPSAVPLQWIKSAKTYRHAVRLAWQLRRVHSMTRQQLATEAELTPQHVSDYLADDDKPQRRDLPADKVAAFESVVGNTLVSQWLAAQSRLTVLEQVQATAHLEMA
jgi:predicted transcriptional regulator